MPDETASSAPHKHLRRLSRIWVDDPVYFITTCVADRRPLLACDAAHAILREVWETGSRLHRWQVGSYVVMPDHVHLFCAPGRDAASLSVFVGGWKEWSSKFLHRRLGSADFEWQPGFFDHVLRSEESYTQKWDYVRHNPVRAGLAKQADDWPFQGQVHFL
jgi:putative transposase